MDGSPPHFDGDSDLRMLVALNNLFLRYWMWFFQNDLESRMMPKILEVVEVVEVLLVVLDSGKDGVVRSESEKDCFTFLRERKREGLEL